MLAEPGPLQRFFAELLAAQGALAEPIEPEGIEALLPPELQQAFGVAEHCRFGFGATLPDGAQRVGIEADWLERCARALGEHGRVARHVLDAGGKLGDPEAALAQELALDNATFRLLDSQPAWTRYLVLDFRYTALSDDKRDGMLRLAINLGTGALPDAVMQRVSPWLDDPADNSAPPAVSMLPSDWQRARLLGVLRRASPTRLDAALEPFVRGLRRRLERDQDRLHGYHNDLHREALLRQAALPPGDKAARSRAVAHRGDRPGIPRQAGRPGAQICAAGRGGMGADAGPGDAGAAAVRADPPPQGRTGDPAGLEPAGAPAGGARLRGQFRSRAPSPRLRRCRSPGQRRRPCALPRVRQGLLPRLPPGRLPEMRRRTALTRRRIVTETG